MTWALKFNPEGHGAAGNDEVVFSPAINLNVRSSTVNWFFEFRLKLDALPSANAYIIGGSTTANTGMYIRLNAGQYTLAFVVSGSLVFQSSADMFLADGQFHTYRIERNITVSNEAIFNRDGAEFGSRVPVTTGTSTLACSRFGRGSSTGTFYTAMELDYFIYSTTTPIYTEWRADLSNGSGTQLLTTDNSRDGTLTNFDVPACWVDYGGVDNTLASMLSATSAVNPSVSSAVQLMSTLANLSALTAAMTAGATGLAANLQARASAAVSASTQITLADAKNATSTVAAQASTQVRMADALSSTAALTLSMSSQLSFASQLNGVASMTVSMSAGAAGLTAGLQNRSQLTSSLQASIRAAALLQGVSLVTANLSSSAVVSLLASQLSSKAKVTANAQAYKQLMFDVVGVPDGTYRTFVRKHLTGEVLYDANAAYVGEKVTLYVSAESGEKVSGYVIDSLNPAESGAVLYGLVS